MVKRSTLLQHGEKRINEDLLPRQWRDDAMHMSDNNPTIYNSQAFMEESAFDANSIDNFDNFEEKPVYDYLGREIGVKSVVGRKKRNNK